ncbi:MAG: PBSX family phage terminase large subunit [Ruminiclostridium sp.]|nr:PBSX family phage terminase large subunit [Ruminiclostridium sp.]
MTVTRRICFDSLIAPSFRAVHRDIAAAAHTHYVLYGGRGSCKSSFVSLEIVRGIMADSSANAVVIRKIGRTIRESVYEQVLWAIDALGAADLWDSHVSIPEIVYKPTGQRIIFRGADDPRKFKSVKCASGYIKYIWYEETDEFSGVRELDVINQSLMRGSGLFFCFYTYNPPRSAASWVNREFAKPRPDRLTHRSDYRDVPPEWLGQAFIAEAEYLKQSDPKRYANEYLGEQTGTGAEVFTNVRLQTIPDDKADSFDRTYRGIDWGYGADPFVYICTAYEHSSRTLYIYREFYRCGARFDEIAEAIKALNGGNYLITADSAEPRSNDELRARGLNIRAAKKGQGSVEYGIRRLCDLNAIIIDPVRCPNAAREFTGYKLDEDGYGGFRSGFPDRDNHTIDAVRYALEERFNRRVVSTFDRRKLGV